MNSTLNVFPFVSIIILNFNGKNFLNNCLQSVLETDYPNYEIIVVDNGSKDGSANYLIRMFQDNVRIKILLLEKNYGYAEGNNRGALYANKNSNYLVFLNNDTKVEKFWIKELIKVMEQDNKIGVAQAKLLVMGDNRKIDCAGAYITRIGQVIECGAGQEDRGQYDYIKEIFYAKGAAMIVRKNLWESLEGFESLFFIYWEEADFCWRVRLMGYKIVFIPNSIVYHDVGRTIHKEIPFLIDFYDSRNRILTLATNYDLENLCKYIPITIVYNFIISILKTFKMRSCLPIFYDLKAILWCLNNLKFIIQRRKYIQTYIRKKSDKKAFSSIMMPKFILHTSEQLCLERAR